MTTATRTDTVRTFIDAHADEFFAQGAEAERLGRLTDETVRLLREAGAMRMGLFSGDDAQLPAEEMLRIVREAPEMTGAQLAEKKPLEATNKVNDKLPEVKFDSATKMLLLGPALEITKDNVDQFNY